ncbi:MAG: hypothetical protein JWM62_158 [Frankiales bacterium]|nr:hypothetical protein [Frankiales bacterium]
MTTTALAPDQQCAQAVELARAAAVEVAGPAVGEHLGLEVEEDRVVTHSFATTDPAYSGWRWAVTVVRADGYDQVTVAEVVLLPGGGALLPPPWVPWAERVQPDDLGPGDLLPPPKDDPRLVPSYADVDAERMPFDLHREMGLGRPRVLSLEGRADAAERWYEGQAGPDAPIAKAAPARCDTCGFFAPMAGALGRVFGACANGMAPDDGRVVALTHGCGAHSETVVETQESTYSGMAVEDDEFEVVERPAEAVAGQDDEVVATADAPEDAGVPGVDDPPLDDVVDATEESDAPSELAGGLADDEGA